MSIQGISTKLISTLGNKESLVPLIVKDGVDSLSITAKGFKEGGVVEGIDRALDEFGTQAIWVGGIPFYKFLIDKTIYKLAKINPKVDNRIIQNNEYATWALKNAQGIMSNSKVQTVKSAIADCLEDSGKKTKALTAAKFVLSTALTLGSYFTLTKLKQKNTKNNVIKSMNLETLQYSKNNSHSFVSKPKDTHIKLFDDIDITKKSNKNPSFKGSIKSLANALIFNPVHNMKIIDAGITTERLVCSRNKVEFAEHAIKEGGFLFFMYKFGNIIENSINKLADVKLNKPIDLNIDVLMDDKFKTALSNNNILDDVSKLPQKAATLTEKLDFLKANPNNILVQAAKKSKIITTLKGSETTIDTSRYIDVDAVEKLAENLKNIDKKFKDSGEDINKFLNKTKCLKVASVCANIAISCIFLGYLIPKAIYAYREWKTGSTKFHVEQDIKNNKNKDIQ